MREPLYLQADRCGAERLRAPHRAGRRAYSKYYDEFVVLLDTGLRVSEFCGLTRKGLDFRNRRIRVDHQLLR